MAAKNIVILGSTGSIGINVLKVIARYPERFKVLALSCYNSFPVLERQIRRFQPRLVAVTQNLAVKLKKSGLGHGRKIFDVDSDLGEMVADSAADVVILGMRGSAALGPFLAAVKAGKTVAPANKEALVIAGRHIMETARCCGANIIPIDSEQSAIFQCLQGAAGQKIRKVYLTASGGPLRNTAPSRFGSLAVKDILRHPRWKMGPKITVDSATLLNKGFEVIEAMRLFDLTAKQVEIIVHPEAIIHSMVEFQDGAIMAQLGVTDMRLPIQYALTFPERLPTGLPPVNFTGIKAFHFERPDLRKFPLLELALDVARRDGTLPAVLNAADEVAVEAFLQEKIRLNRVCDVVEKVVGAHRSKKDPSLRDIIAADQWAREETRIQLGRL
jgi:1-deoxy-D-xylulose-5-phosphate reductoisomerase